MITVILFICLVNSLMTPTTHGAIDFKSKKPIMCVYDGTRYLSAEPRTSYMDPTRMPKECEVIIFTGFEITVKSEISLDTDVIKKLTSLKKPVYLLVNREKRYADWITVLKADGNAADAKAITDFAAANKVQGVIFWCISPILDSDVLTPSVGKNIIPYFKQLKAANPDFVVGLYIQPWSPDIMVDPCVYNYDELNNVVDFYVANSFLTNACNLSSDTITPNQRTVDSGFGIDSIDQDLRTTSINCDMIYFVIELTAMTPDFAVTSYGQVCRESINSDKWCIPTTKGLYEQAKFIKGLKHGVVVMWVELDDINNVCGCSSFVGIQNIAAGCNGAPQIPCEKFDIKSSSSP